MLMFDFILFDNFYYNLVTQAAGSVIGIWLFAMKLHNYYSMWLESKTTCTEIIMYNMAK